MNRIPATVSVSIFLLMFAIPSATWADGHEPAADDTGPFGGESCHKVVVYYLYRMPRCDTCLRIEAYAQEAIETGFADELRLGNVEWHAYDAGQPEHEHYWDDFKLEVKSLVMVEIQDGEQIRWKNCEKIWDLVDDKPAFLSYVRAEVQAYLGAR